MSSNIATTDDTKNYTNPDTDDILTDDSDSSDGIYIENDEDDFSNSVPIPSLIHPMTKVYTGINDVYNEFCELTGMNLTQIIQEKQLHGFELVRLVNYLRYHVSIVSGKETTESAVSSSSSSSSSLINSREQTIRTKIQELFQNTTLFDRTTNLWTDEKWLIPVLPEDPLIMAILATDDNNEEENITTMDQEEKKTVTTTVVSNREELLQQEIQRLRKELASANSMLQSVLNDDTTTDDDDDEDNISTSENTTNQITSNVHTKSKRTSSSKDKSKGHTGTGTQDNDTYYFDSYAGAGIHAEMLQDTIRTIAYKQAILGNKNWFDKRTVLDVGCGSGILSLFSADAGASWVIALDASSILEDAKKIIALNHKDNVIECVRGKAEKLSSTLAPQSVDIIVSEWMGYALHYEGMLASVLDTRDALLKPGGRMFPSHAHIYVGALSDEPFWRNRVSGWENVYGYNMNPLARYSFPEAHVVVIPSPAVVSVPPHNCISTMNTCTMTKHDLDIVNAPLHLIIKGTGLSLDDDYISPDERLNENINRPIRIHGLIMWFDIDFSDAVYDPTSRNNSNPSAMNNGNKNVTNGNGISGDNHGKNDSNDDDDAPPLEDGSIPVTASPSVSISSSVSSIPQPPDTKPTGLHSTKDGQGTYHHVYFSTGPFTTPTHWQQTVFLFQEPIIANQGEEIKGTMDMIRDIVNPRCYRFRANLALHSPGGTVTQKREYSWQMR